MTDIDVADIRSYYRSGTDNLGRDFFAPCLQLADEYKRAAGFFSSSALVTWASGLPRIVTQSRTAIKLIISPKLSERDLKVIQESSESETGETAAQDAIDEYFVKALEFAEEPENIDLRLDIFGWLIEENRLAIRLAIANHMEASGMFHDKYGVFAFPNGQKVAFIGSANESHWGHEINGEILMAFRSWVEGDKSRINELEKEFDETWNGRSPGTKVYKPSASILEQLAEISRASRRRTPVQIDEATQRPPPWPHQQKAIDEFLTKRHGVLEMATGTGKTRTALEIACSLIRSGAIDTFILATDGNDLLDQWRIGLLDWRRSEKLWDRVHSHYKSFRESEAYLLNPSGACLVVSRSRLAPILARVNSKQKEHMLIIHDEVHGLGAPGQVTSLSGKHAGISFTLGLSATPEREYDLEGTQFIETEIGPIIFQFDLKEAIEKSILCEFDYVPLTYRLTDSDKRRLQNVWAMKSARQHEGRPMSDAEVAIELSKVYKTAEEKPEIFRDFVRDNTDCLEKAIIFVETRAYGEHVLPIVQERTIKYKTYYADEEEKYLRLFASNELDCLITCHKLSQGIDIPSLETVVLFSSARAKLETIQRIGRCLRKDKTNIDKRALVVDFVLASEDTPEGRVTADQERAAWLTEVSRVKGSQNNGN